MSVHGVADTSARINQRLIRRVRSPPFECPHRSLAIGKYEYVRKLLVGLSGPIGYDYQRPEGRREHLPNPVLEDVNGLLICYDELIFLSRATCPADMRDLDYVRFLEDDSESMARASVAIEQFLSLSEQASIEDFFWSGLQASLTTITGGDPACSIDNHSRPLHALPPELPIAGNAADVRTAFADVGIAASLELDNLDVLTNSLALRSLGGALQQLDPAPHSAYAPLHIGVAQELGSIRVPNLWTRRGSYQPSIEDLRSHPEVESFRAFLSEQAHGASLEAAERAAAITRLADEYARKALRDQVKKASLRQTVGRAGVPLLNLAVPHAGTAVGGLLKLLDWKKQRDEVAESGWARFVIDLPDANATRPR